jgi:penicillin-binding protein 2
MRGRYSSGGADRRERALVLRLVGLAVMLVLLGRLASLQILSRKESQDLALRNWRRPEFVPGPRGRILDRNGVVLADMIPSFMITFDPHFKGFIRHADRLDSTLVRLAGLVGDDPAHYRQVVKREGPSSYNPIRLVRGADSTQVARVEEHRAELPGVSVEVEAIRYYPADSLAAHVLGYTGEVGDKQLESLEGQGYRPGSLIGQTGIEKEYEEQLRGEDGTRYVEVNATGHRSDAFLSTQPIPPKPGRDVTLALDTKIQRVAEEALDQAGYDGRDDPPEVKGAAVLLDVRNGDVLAMASRPGFDPNVFSGALSQETWDSLNRPSAPLLNRAIQSQYPPGSVFKPLAEYAALADGVIHPGQTLSPCFGGFRFGNRTFRCWKRSGHGTLTDVQAMAQSCDVYFYQLAVSLGVNGIAHYGELFHFADPTGIDLPGERGGLVPDTRYFDRRYGTRGWSHGVALNLIIGQGEILVTPIELADYTAVLATKGRRPRPRLVEALGPERRDRRYPEPSLAPSYTEIPLDPAAVAEVQKGMRAAVEEGTAHNASVPGETVAGKTGTAQNPGFDHALFIAYAPADDPQVAVAVVLENRGHGGSVAAPVAQRILAAYFGVTEAPEVRVQETD